MVSTLRRPLMGAVRPCGAERQRVRDKLLDFSDKNFAVTKGIELCRLAMKSRQALIQRLFAVGLVAFSVSACVFGPAGTVSTPFDVPAGNDERQAALGAREHPKVVASYGGIYRNEEAELEVARIVGGLVAASENPAQSYAVTLLNSPAINAFALPGGYLYITRGLIALANDEAELGAVIAHEMAHVTRNHALDRSRKAVATALADRVLTQVVDDPKEAATARLNSERSFSEFTQAQELQADEVGIKTLAGAGLDAFAAARFLTAMERFSEAKNAALSSSSRAPDFLATHPATPERIEQAKRTARQFGAPGLGKTNRERYLTAIDGLRYGDTEDEGFVRGRRYLHKELGFQFQVPDGYVIENTSEAVLATNSDGTAMRFDGVRIRRGQGVRAYLTSGWVNGLDNRSIRVNRGTNGVEIGTATATAQGWAYRIGIVRNEAAAYRFIFATRTASAVFNDAFEQTIASFRGLSAEEARNVGALAIRVVKAQRGDSFEAYARTGLNDIPVAEAAALLRALNGLSDRQQPRPGQLIKTLIEVLG